MKLLLAFIACIAGSRIDTAPLQSYHDILSKSLLLI